MDPKSLQSRSSSECKLSQVSGLVLFHGSVLLTCFLCNVEHLQSPYAPCLLGFEGHRGNRTPTVKGVVVHDHNADLLREASIEVVSKSMEDENERRRHAIFSRWKKLLVGLLTQERLEREYCIADQPVVKQKRCNVRSSGKFQK